MPFHFFAKQVFAIEQAALPSAPPPLPIRFRFGTTDDLKQQSGHPDYGFGSIPFLEGRLRAGDKFILGEVDGQPVMTAWLMIGKMEIGELVIEMPGDHAYNYKIYTVENYRRKGATRALWHFLRKPLEEAGCTRMLNTVIRGNVPSMEAHKRAGFRPIGSFVEMGLGTSSGYLLSRPLRKYLRDFTLPF